MIDEASVRQDTARGLARNSSRQARVLRTDQVYQTRIFHGTTKHLGALHSTTQHQKHVKQHLRRWGNSCQAYLPSLTGSPVAWRRAFRSDLVSGHPMRSDSADLSLYRSVCLLFLTSEGPRTTRLLCQAAMSEGSALWPSRMS